MKKIILLLCAILIYSCGKQTSKTNNLTIRDGFYEVITLPEGSGQSYKVEKNEVMIPFDTLFSPGDYTSVIVDTTEYVPLELASNPTTEQQTGSEKSLSISLAPGAAEKMKTFTATRIMKQAIIVLDGKAITMNKIRDTISGSKMQITRSGDHACEYLYNKMKDKALK